MRRVLVYSSHDKSLSLRVPTPKNVQDFRFIFSWNELEHDSDNMPAEAEHNGRVGMINLNSAFDHSLYTGKHAIKSHPAKNVSITKSEHGFSFDIVCVNRNPCVANQVFWSCYMSRKELDASIKSSTLILDGECLISHSLCVAHLMLNAAGGISDVSIAIPENELREFTRRLVEDISHDKK